ncbi:MAG TPA: type II toxin-antitoxin system VapC family toxin [Bryobacteraceae bacterium]|nr:type II toxin-antitoxin system VapC family toxin [Bryobacteraceae bacterium]
MKLLIDSDILIEVSRGRDPMVIRDWKALSVSSSVLSCSPVTVAELWHGGLPEERDALEDLFAALLCLPVDHSIGRLAGDYLRRYRRSYSLALGDALIAATSTVHSAPLWTRNRKHYPMREVSFWDRVVE